ncbi:MlaD family protein [Actinocorallia sp. A-T 12471]|uniref:MlaD family protein n=1 Tax=Actinocorallia sp. A-T 12471 TaxID=3089813 RepID=UPI0029CC26A8|nr:MlaD family protein [Actinocorallia sp. A-T 12471]MDX6743602.1 MlaD family protein [Actinocorallia sp. A-T 12471]
MRTRLAALAAALPLLMSGGCAVLPGGGTSVTVYFDRATSFYEGSHVLVMGVDVGTVNEVVIEGDRVRVRATVDAGVPLPADVKASIMPMNLVGERNLVLFPPYSPGKPKAKDGHVIEQADTTLPIETDEALAAFTEVLAAIDPLQARRVTQKAAAAFDGNGQAFNAALQQTGQLTETLGGQADALAQLADNLASLAEVVEGKEDALGTMIEQVSSATEVFAQEREAIRTLVEGLVKLVRSGDVLLQKYEGTLADDVRVLTQVSLVVKGNSEQLAQLVEALPGVARAFLKSWNRKSHVAELQFAVDPSLRALMKQLGLPDECLLPAPTFSNCPWEDK